MFLVCGERLRVPASREKVVRANTRARATVVTLATNTTMDKPSNTSEDPFAAIKNGDLPLLKSSLQNGADVNSQDKDGMSLLHHAINSNHLGIVKFLLEKGANATLLNNNGQTTLHVAASRNHIAIVNLLLNNVNHDELRKFMDAKTVPSSTTAIHVASASGFYEMTRLMLSRGAAYDLKNNSGKQPIDVSKDRAISELLDQVNENFEQAKDGDEKLYETLEKCSIDKYSAYVNARNCDGYSIVQIAILNNHANLATLLQCSKVALFRVNGHKPTFSPDRFDELLLLATTASKKLQDEMSQVDKFISTFRSFDKRVIDPNVLAIEDMLTLLNRYPDSTSILQLTKQVIEVYLKLFSASIYSMKLLESTRRKDWPVAEKCMSEMAYVNLADDGGWTPLLHAINAGNASMVKTLIAYGARVNCWTKTGRNTSLHVAVNGGKFDIVQLLLERDTTSEFLNAKTEAKGSTALHVAAKNGRMDIVVWLLKCGAIYCLMNKDGKVPMEMTSDESIKGLFILIDEFFDDVRNGRDEVIDKLEALGDDEFLAVVLCQNEEGLLMKDVALVNGRERITSAITDMLKEILEQKGFKFNEK